MNEVFRTLVVPAALTPLARALAAGLSARGVGMFSVPLAPTEAGPATHYASSGYIDGHVAALLADADALYAACQQAGASVTLAQCQALVSQSDVTAEDPFGVMARLGLVMVVEGEAGE